MKTKREKILMAVPYFLLWLLYVLLTLNRRSEYQMAVAKGYQCTHSEDGLTSRTYYFDPSLPPQRRYLTWKEFWTARGYYHTEKETES